MPHHFTVDVEEYYHPNPLEPWIPRDRWPALEPRARGAIDRLLGTLDEHGVKATFFVLGSMAESDPDMVRAISDGGHEVASHGWNHRLVSDLGPEGFREDVRRSRRTLEDAAGVEVTGFRAPSFSIVPGLEWSLDILLEEGYLYDSSLFPVRMHPQYGYPCDRDPHVIQRPSGAIVEIPPTTLRVLGENLPASGGAYFRVLPYAFLRAALRAAEKRGAAGTFYIHPWELDVNAPRLPIPWYLRWRTRARTGDPWARISRLLGDFTFCRVDTTVRRFQGRISSENAA